MCSVSVIIPVYNAGRTLRKCVEALFFGKEKALEIILIDDCSSDDSWEICNILANEYTNVYSYRNEKNQGVSFTRNRGIALATAPYILFVDSDDWTSTRYASRLLSVARENEDALTICGYTFIDQISSFRSYVTYGSEDTVSVDVSDAFSLYEKTLLQQLWNKIFRRDLIEANHIRFDESQSMGEDFQFVLDYMEAAQIKTCVVLNEALYYYIRWNNNSLMSKFGFIDNQPELDRMEQLARISGAAAEEKKKEMIAQIKRNYLYHIARNTAHTKSEKITAIERIMDDGKSVVYYREQKIQHAKEQCAVFLRKVQSFVPRLKGYVQRIRLQKKIHQTVDGVNAQGITIISQNCIGGVLYHDLGMQFLSPTINTFIPEPGFVKLTLNLRYYMEQELVMRWEEEYPVGMLGDVEIHFMHYATCSEAKECWERRKKRINWDKILVIGTDRDGFDDAVYEQWKRITYSKLLFTAHQEYSEDALFYPEFAADGQVGDLIGKRQCYKDGILLEILETRYDLGVK